MKLCFVGDKRLKKKKIRSQIRRCWMGVQCPSGKNLLGKFTNLKDFLEIAFLNQEKSVKISKVLHLLKIQLFFKQYIQKKLQLWYQAFILSLLE